MATAEEKIGIPDYPCVAVLGSGVEVEYRGEKKDLDGEVIAQVGKQLVTKDTVRFLPVRSYDDTVPHVEYLRKHKGWPVVGYYNLEKIVKDENGQMKKDTKMLINALHGMINNPEVQQLRKELERLSGTKENPEIPKLAEEHVAPLTKMTPAGLVEVDQQEVIDKIKAATEPKSVAHVEKAK